MRLDIQLLRVLAVVAVVLAHYFPGFVPGGYVGVDVFFVISGFLMASLLLREGSLNGQISITKFWLMRATRLFPQAFAVLLVVIVVTFSFLPQRDWIIHMPDAIASAFFAENLLLAYESQDYFASVQETSALQHYWSLGVEEQFYVLLPLVMASVFMLSRKNSKFVIGLVSAISILCSLAYSQYLVLVDPVVGYFHTLSRIWELAIGVLVAVIIRNRASSRRESVFGFIGFGMIFVSILAFDSTTPFPGLAALLPVVGTALVINFGPTTLANRVGSWKPVSWLAEHSYGIYLWHWPALTLYKQISGENPSPLVKALLIALAIFGAWVTTRFVEKPIRFGGRKAIKSNKHLGAITIGAIASILLVASVPAAGLQSALVEQDRQLKAAQERFDSSQKAATGEAVSDCVGPEELDPLVACLRSEDGFDFFPSIEAADADDDNRRECWSTSNSERFNICELGALEGYSKSVFIVGDSHAAAMIGAFDLLGQQEGWKIQFAGKGGCFWTAAPLKKPESVNTQYCLDWRDKIQAYLDDSEPFDFLIVTNSARTARGVLTDVGQTFEQPATQGLSEAWKTQINRGVPVFAIKDNPFPIPDHLDCIEKSVTDPRIECHIETWDGFETFDPIVAAVDRTEGSYLVDLSQYYCDLEYCSPIVGGVLVYRDDSHITATWAKLLVPYISGQINGHLETLN